MFKNYNIQCTACYGLNLSIGINHNHDIYCHDCDMVIELQNIQKCINQFNLFIEKKKAYLLCLYCGKELSQKGSTTYYCSNCDQSIERSAIEIFLKKITIMLKENNFPVITQEKE